MKVIFVSPPFGASGQKSKGLPIAPPVLEYLAGLTQQVCPGTEVKLIDANRGEFDPETVQADLVGFTVLTPQAPWAYRMGDKLRARGIPVVFGGIHVSALPEEAAPHADSLVLGEAEGVWAQVLEDVQNSTLKPIYQGVQGDLTNLPHPITDFHGSNYIFGSFFTSRGCPHRCSFCSVHKFFGGSARMRPVDEVVKEVAASRRRLFWNIDDNIWGVNHQRSIELYREMAQNVRGKWWFGAGDLVTVQQPKSEELLHWARKAGCTSVMVGWESNNLQSLEEYNAKNKQGRDRVDAIKKIRDAGIDVMLFVMVGGRQDSYADFEGIVELCDKLNISAHPVMTTPFPKTDLYCQYEPHLIPGMDWDLFDGNRAVYVHDDPKMTPQNREEAVIYLRAKLFTWPRILNRITEISAKGFPMAHITSFMVQASQGTAFKQYAKEYTIKQGRG
jgi:radical SAM superfamily enzyme YgiQ (UPF0313 family)